MNQSVRCCKSFVLMISPGKGVADGNAPDLQSPFGNLFTGTNIGVVSTGDATVIDWTTWPIMDGRMTLRS